jgi:hypothetical protein
MTSPQEIVPVQFADGTRLHIKATILGREEDVAFKLLSFEQVTDTIEHVATALTAALKKAKPKKASVEFGLEIAVDSGKLTALLVESGGTATIKIALEWGE